MWDQGEGRFVGKRFLSRVCDDLAGAAAALAMLDHLAAKPPRAGIAVLLTRGEEEGFIGAIAASLHPRLLRKTDLMQSPSNAPPLSPSRRRATARSSASATARAFSIRRSVIS